jgi:phosphoribosyl-AMP cyclohydrolase / phosphoribosyl-ATP pyrophosphohydrolase
VSQAAEALVAAVTFDRDGLVPVIAQDAATGVVRMVAWANAEALRATFAAGQATFWSRSRQQLWRKGAESGNVMPIREVRLDCDGDAVLYLCDPVGPSCHTGKTSCFYRSPAGGAPGGPLHEDGGPPEVPSAILSRLVQVIRARRSEPAEKSYVSSLLVKGVPKINAKVLEEAGEVTEAFTAGDRQQIAHEVADVLFHLLVGLEATAVPLDDVFSELRRRFGTSGHTEKASRRSGEEAAADSAPSPEPSPRKR